MRAGLLLVTKTDEVEVVAGGLEALGIGEGGLEAEAEEDVLQGIEPREERILLEHDEAIPARGRHRLIPEADFSLIGVLQAGQQAKQGRLAATRRAYDGQELPFPHIQADILQGGDLTRLPLETFGHVVEGERRRSGCFFEQGAHGEQEAGLGRLTLNLSSLVNL